MNGEIRFKVVFLQTGKIDGHKEAMRLLYNHACGVQSLEGYEFLQRSGIVIQGEEIWKGDILATDEDERCVVVFENGAFKRSYLPFLTEKDKSHPDFYEKDFVHYFDRVDFEIWKKIGGIYENPELLK